MTRDDFEKKMTGTIESMGPIQAPTVCCVLLTRDRPAMAARAVASFRAQTYERKKMIVIDTSPAPIDINGPHVTILHNPLTRDFTIGELRNTAASYAAKRLAEQPDIIAHWDDDDWSHPNRLAEQVALLQCGADLVGYNDCLFWDTRMDHVYFGGNYHFLCAAWLYRNPIPSYVLGTSMMYWRRTWEAHPFDAVSHGEDERFRLKCGKVVGVSSLGTIDDDTHILTPAEFRAAQAPKMVCSIHGANTSPFDPARSPAMCRRVPQWDAYCARVMALEVRA